jgi:exodeoxyribonuclease-1
MIHCDADAIRDRVFTSSADLPAGTDRLPLKAVKWNAVPMLAPASVLTGVDQDRIGLDTIKCKRNAELLKANIPIRISRCTVEVFSTITTGAKCNMFTDARPRKCQK